jgi:hypothetical protein
MNQNWYAFNHNIQFHNVSKITVAIYLQKETDTVHMYKKRKGQTTIFWTSFEDRGQWVILNLISDTSPILTQLAVFIADDRSTDKIVWPLSAENECKKKAVCLKDAHWHSSACQIY